MVASGVLLHHGIKIEEAFNLVSQKRGVDVPDTEEQYNWVLENYKDIVKV